MPTLATSAPAARVAAPALPVPLPEVNRAAPPPINTAPAPGAAWPGDFPDPSVVRVGGAYFAFGTEKGLTVVQTLQSNDLVHWQYDGSSLANLPEWATLPVWAPAVVPTPAGYVMFYAAQDKKTGDMCIGRAISAGVAGPFVDPSVNPFLCQLGLGGSIDPNPFVDADGSDWLVWRSMGTVNGQPARLWAQRVSGDWNIPSGAATPILRAGAPWESGVIERPAMVRQGGAYYLLYSGNAWNTANYAVGYAVCRSVAGPCLKASRPILSSHGTEAGPGSTGVFTDLLGQPRVAYDSWTAPDIGYPNGARSLHIGTLHTAGLQVAISEP